MTAKEKANELYDKFDNLHCTTCDEYPELEVCRLCHHQIKQCALICCYEILKLPNIGYSHNRDESQYDYWQEVKQQIEKL